MRFLENALIAFIIIAMIVLIGASINYVSLKNIIVMTVLLVVTLIVVVVDIKK